MRAINPQYDRRIRHQKCQHCGVDVYTWWIGKSWVGPCPTCDHQAGMTMCGMFPSRDDVLTELVVDCIERGVHTTASR